MRTIIWLTLLTVFLCPAIALPQQASTDAAAASPVFRDPFTLRLRIDRDHFYEEHFDKTPYVAENDVYLFSGDKFGINVIITNNEISRVTYQPDAAKADVEFRFTQEKIGGRETMLLVIQNKLKRMLFLDALMTVPQDKGIHKTSIVPVEPGLPDYESWPHPIVQLVLRNLRFSEKAPDPGKDHIGASGVSSSTRP